MHNTPLFKIPLWQWFKEKLTKYLQRDIDCSLNKKRMKVAIINYYLLLPIPSLLI